MRTPRRTPAPRLALLALAAAALTACGSASGSPQLLGAQLPEPYTKPAVTLTDTTGRPYDVPARTAGAATLVYFGYTHCPDVCPTAMADTAAALRALPQSVRDKTRVLFVSSDPARDTPAVLADWLGAFDFGRGTTVTGLTGPYDVITRFATALNVPLEKPVVTAGNYEVGHGARLTGFTLGGKGTVAWLPGEGQQLEKQLRHDLPLLVAAT